MAERQILEAAERQILEAKTPGQKVFHISNQPQIGPPMPQWPPTL